MNASYVEAANKLRERADQKVQRAQKAFINKVMKDDATVIARLYDLAMHHTQGAQASDVSSASEKKNVAKPGTDDEEKMPEGYIKYGYLSVTLLSRLLEKIEPVAFSLYQTKKLSKKGQRYVNKFALLELLEFVTGKSSSDDINHVFVKDVVGELKQLSEENGRRGMSLELPPDFNVHGAFKIEKKGPKIWLVYAFAKQRKSKEKVEITPELLGCKVVLSQLTIANNFSEFRALLKSSGSSIKEGIMCFNLFLDAKLSEYQKKEYAGVDIDPSGGPDDDVHDDGAVVIEEPEPVKEEVLVTPKKEKPGSGKKQTSNSFLKVVEKRKAVEEPEKQLDLDDAFPEIADMPLVKHAKPEASASASSKVASKPPVSKKPKKAAQGELCFKPPVPAG